MGATLTWEAIKEKYPPEHHIIVTPVIEMTMGHDSSIWRLDAAVVHIDPNNPKMVFKVEGGGMALSRPALDLLAAAAEVSIKPEQLVLCGRPLILQFNATAVVKTPNGEVRGQVRSRTWNEDIHRDRVRFECEAYAAKNNSKPDELETRFKKLWLAEREFGPVKTESKACGRAIRSILGLDGAYPFDVLHNKAFVLPRWVLDVSHPEVRNIAIRQGFQSGGMLWGPGAGEQPALIEARPVEAVTAEVIEPVVDNVTPAPVTVIETGEGRTVNTATGEIVSGVDPEPVEALPPEPGADPEPARVAPDDLPTLSVELSKAVMAFKPAQGSDVTTEKLNKRWTRAVEKNDLKDMKTMLVWLWNREGGNG